MFAKIEQVEDHTSKQRNQASRKNKNDFSGWKQLGYCTNYAALYDCDPKANVYKYPPNISFIKFKFFDQKNGVKKANPKVRKKTTVNKVLSLDMENTRRMLRKPVNGSIGAVRVSSVLMSAIAE